MDPTTEAEYISRDIFEDIVWPDPDPQQETLGFDYDQCLDCLLEPNSTCPSCSLFVPGAENTVSIVSKFVHHD